MNHAKLATANIALHLVLTIMDAIWWGDTGYVSPHFLDVGNIICYVPPVFLVGFVFGEVSKLNVTFVTFDVKSFSC